MCTFLLFLSFVENYCMCDSRSNLAKRFTASAGSYWPTSSTIRDQRTTLRAPPRIDCQLYSYEPPSLYPWNRKAIDTPATASDNWRRSATTPSRTLHRLVTSRLGHGGTVERAANRWLKL